ncbi:MAG: FlgD immunoglobulin-like domain containing protein [candidate division Zixibacteria bacterium]|nr:FlgD immunoglobulin-like domain containing protein [candidate division Zixibacteria bacterium]
MRILKNLPLISIAFFWCFLGCGSSDLAVADENTLVIERFPAKVGNSWEYRRTFVAMFYDTLYTDTTQTVIVGSLHTGFQGIDTLRNWECYRYFSQLFEAGDTFSDIAWYAHPDTAFLGIAYLTSVQSPGKRTRNTNFKLGKQFFSSMDELRRYLFQIRNFPFGRLELDTGFWDPPIKMFVFPLSVGRVWTATTDPWLDKRQAIEENFAVVPAGSFLTLKIKITWHGWDMEFYQWISENGIVKDSLYAKAIATNEQGEIIGYIEAYDKYELLDYKTDVKESIVENSIPKNFSLEQNYPNPFNPTTKIQFKVGSLEFGRPLHTTLKIYNILGQLVKTLVDEEKLPGNYKVIWDGKDDSGKEVASGIYFYQLKAKDYTDTKKMVLLR